MKVHVEFFSRLREVVDAADLTIDLPDKATVAALLAELYQRYPALAKWDDNILVGAHLEFVGRDYPLRPGDEIAIMPPVQGG